MAFKTEEIEELFEEESGSLNWADQMFEASYLRIRKMAISNGSVDLGEGCARCFDPENLEE